MARFRLFTITALSCWIGVCFVQCSKSKPDKPPAPVSALKPQDDYKATMDAYTKADNPETKIRLWLEFLKRNPNNQYTVGTINYVARNYFLEQKKDPDGAVKFASENLANLKDETLKRRGDLTLLSLYAKTGDKERLRELAGQMEKRRGLTLDNVISVGNAALEAKDWEFARKEGELLLAKNTPQTIRAEAGKEERSDEQVAESVQRNRAQALIILGRAAIESNDVKTALAHFDDAAKAARHQYAGPLSWPYEDLNLHWARAFLKSGNPRAAMDKIAVEAVIQGGKTALEVLQEALRAAGSKETLQQYVERMRPKIAKTMPVFSAYDYNRKKVSWDELKGKVTLVAFWFPT